MSDGMRQIAEWSFDLPSGWFIMPVAPGTDARSWARGVVAEVRADRGEGIGTTGGILDALERAQASVAARADDLTSAAVLIDPEVVMTIGCVLTGRQLELEPGDGPDDFEQMLRDGLENPGVGVRTISADVWRENLDVGEVVAATQRFERRDIGDADGAIADRAVYGVFPPASVDVITLDFIAENLVEFDDIRARTSEFVRALRLEMEPVE